MKWYELALVRTSPAKILVIPMAVKSYYGNVNSAYKTFWMPHLLPLNLNGGFEGKSLCLLSLISKKQAACYPLYYIFPDKKGVVCDDSGRILGLGTSYKILSQSDAAHAYDSRVKIMASQM